MSDRNTKQLEEKKRDGEVTSKESTREEKRQKKLLQRQHREQQLKEQKEAALRRAADLVRSNRIPIEITRGASVSKSGEMICPKCGNKFDLICVAGSSFVSHRIDSFACTA